MPIQQNKKRPLVVAHKGGDYFGKENSIASIIKSIDAGVDAVEVDLRRSIDGILFCYHGNILETLWPSFFFNKTFAELRTKYKDLSSLEEVAKAVSNKVALLIEVKDYSIPVSEIEATIKKFKISEVYLLAIRFTYHSRENKLPERWKRVLNARMFFPWIPLSKILKIKANVVELVPWNYTEGNISKLRHHNIDAALINLSIIFGFNKSIKKYAKLAFKFKAHYVSAYDLPELIDEVDKL